MPQKIIIIGAGPVGCFLGQNLKSFGFDPLLIEEHQEVGRPIHCTGLVGRSVFEEKGLFNMPSSSIINEINGAVIHYGSQSFTIFRKKVAFVIDRERFDKELSRDLNIEYRNRFLGFEKGKGGYIVGTDHNELFTDILIGADGANSTLRKALNPLDNIQYYKGVQFRIKIKAKYKDMVEVYLKAGSFYWIVPESADIIRVGTISENPYRDLLSFLKDIKFKGQMLEKFGGMVVVGICNTTVKDNIALVGDAACQLKPLTFGGIYFGLKSASILSACIRDGKIDAYDRLWKKELASEIKIGLKVRAVYSRLKPQELSKIFKLIRKQKTLIEKVGDFENHSRMILELIKKPSFYPQIGELFQILVRKII